MKLRLLAAAGVLVMLVVAGSNAQAAPITGNLWIVSEAVSQNAIPGNVPGTPADVTFLVNAPLDFDSAALGSGYSVNAWLTQAGAFGITGSASALGSSLNPILVNFTGTVTVTNGMTFNVTHDDGLTLIIGGLTVINAPGPTAPVTTTATYTGPAGNFPFQLVYGECCGAPAVLQVDLPFQPAVPEPASLVLLGMGLVGAVRAVRKRR